MDPTLRDIERQRELLLALATNPHSATPGFQGFLTSKLAELNAKKQTLVHSSSAEVPGSVRSETTREPNTRYTGSYDDTEETSATATARASSIESFTTTGELFEGWAPKRLEKRAEKSGNKRLDESWDLEDLSKLVSGGPLPAQKITPSSQTHALGSSSPSERKLREMYETEKARADAERLKAQETILAMKARLLQEKERHIDDMIQLLKASSGLQGSPPAARSPSLYTPGQARSPVKANTEPPSFSIGDKAKALAPTLRLEMTAQLPQKQDPDDPDSLYTRTITNDSEALRDEYEQNFESVLDSTEISNSDKFPT